MGAAVAVAVVAAVAAVAAAADGACAGWRMRRMAHARVLGGKVEPRATELDSRASGMV